jgi:hypothetical protein
MSLPSDIARCPGRANAGPAGAWPFPQWQTDCLDCARRIAGIADYTSGAQRVLWMEPPAADPCPEILRSKEPRRG